MKRTYYYALTDVWNECRCLIPVGDEGRSPDFVQRWVRVKRERYLEYRREGFWTKTNKRRQGPRRRHGPLRGDSA